MKKDRASAIIQYENGMIVIKRIKGYGKNKEEYYTIPGGGRENGETIEEATIREIKEELGIDISLTDKYYEIQSQDRKQYFYIAKYQSGKIGSGQGEEMTNVDYNKYGKYIPEIIPINEINKINLLPAEIKNIIVSNLDKIFKLEVESEKI